MKRLTLLVAVVVMGVLATAPVLAQVEGPNFDDQESESGGIETETELAIEGNNNSSCVGLAEIGQGGNFSNMQGTTQDTVVGDDNEFGGGEVELTPEQAAECEQEIQQAAAASSGKAEKAAPKEEKKKEEKKKEEAKPAPKEEKKEEAKPAPKEEKKAEVKPEKKEEAKPAPKEEKKEEKKKELPPSGGTGSASLLALGAGALLVGGGLLARRIIR